MSRLNRSENVAYHAARLLLLIQACGFPRRGTIGRGVRGRTLLAKLDFFLRYPAYLARAMTILAPLRPGLAAPREEAGQLDTDTVESRMVRYLYGPWDHAYYTTLSYLIGKGLIVIEVERGSEVFRLTPRGTELAQRLAQEPAYRAIAERAALAFRTFHDFSGTRIKRFIYSQFPEVVARRIGASI